MASYLKCAFKKSPNQSIGYVAAGGSDWGYVYAATDGGEPLVKPPPTAGSGVLIQSSAHNGWFVNMGVPNYATWKFKGMPVSFSSGNTISQIEYPQLKLCIPSYPDNNWMRWMDENFYPNFDDVVLVFTWEQK
jgi:hypothetical protein